MRYLEPLAYVALLLAALLACGGGTDKETPTAAGPVINVSAVDFTREYRGSEVMGDKKFGGKTVRVTGVGHYHAKCPAAYLDNTPCMMLEGADVGDSILWVWAVLAESERAKASRVPSMSTISLTCPVAEENAADTSINDGKVIGVTVYECTNTSFVPQPPGASARPARTPPAVQAGPKPKPRKR